MTTTASKPLSVKQQQVFNLLDRGVAIPEIAKRMNITRAGVYSHMRKIREAGVTLPTERAESNGDSGEQHADLVAGDIHYTVTTVNGDTRGVDEIIEEQIKIISEKENALQEEHKKLQARVREIEETHHRNQDLLTAHRLALKAYRGG